MVAGRRRYDMTSAWGGHHPLDLTTVVVTHQRPSARPEDDENFVFVTTGIADAVARAGEIASDKDVGINGGEIARQGFDRGAAGPAVLGCHQVSAIGGLVKRP